MAMTTEEIRELYPEGTQIVLHKMSGEDRMQSGLKGIIKSVDDAGQIHVSWANGSSLALVVGVDTFEKVEPLYESNTSQTVNSVNDFAEKYKRENDTVERER